VFGAALGVGKLVGPTTAPLEHAMTGEHDTMPQAAAMPGGLQVAQDGYRLVPATTQLSTTDPADFRFHIVGPDGKPVTAYATAHEKQLHLIVVRRDLTGFQHVHPRLTADGIWSILLRVNEAGPYRVFADFQPEGHGNLVLGVDVNAPGNYEPAPAPQATSVSTVDGYAVTLEGQLAPGTASKLTLAVSKDGVPVTDLQPYLGAFGHLVALRDGDLAYLHVHPQESTQAGPQIVFHAEVPSPGTYRLFLDFQHNGIVRTADFTATTHDGHSS
jgi:hypothetical protein